MLSTKSRTSWPSSSREVLGDRQAREGHTRAGPRGLVHLAVHEGCLGAWGLVLLDHAAGHHLVVQVVALARALTHTSEDAVAPMLQSDVVDELHDDHGLADARPAEEADLPSLGVRGEQVYDLDTREELLRTRAHLCEGRRGSVDGVELLRLDGPELVDRLADDVHDPPERLLSDGHGDGRPGVQDLLATGEAVGAVHGDGAHHVLAEVLRHLEDKAYLVVLDFECVEDRWKLALECHVHHGADHLRDLAKLRRSRCGRGSLGCEEPRPCGTQSLQPATEPPSQGGHGCKSASEGEGWPGTLRQSG